MNGVATKHDEFVSLREEIRAIRARLFYILMVGLVGVPLLVYIGSKAEFFVWLLLPYSVLLLIVTFLSEQSSMMRAGRYIRERIEQDDDSGPQWETWIESRPQFRVVDKHYIACFMVVFFLYYFMTVGLVINLILNKEATDMSGGATYRYWLYGGLITYTVGAVWAMVTLFQHWKTTTSTTSNRS